MYTMCCVVILPRDLAAYMCLMSYQRVNINGFFCAIQLLFELRTRNNNKEQHIYTCICMYVCIYAYIYIYIYIYILYTYICQCSSA